MRLLCQNDGPALILNNLEGYNTPEIPLIFNPFGTRERTAMMIDERDPLESKKKHARLLGDRASWIDPVVVDRDQASCKEVVINKEDISLDKQLPHVWFGKEAASYITGAVGITHDPETGERNVGCYRMTQLWNAVHPMGEEYPEEQQKKQLSVFAFWNPPMSHIGLHLAKATAMGKPLEVAFACQCDPAIHLAAATGLAFGQDEFRFAGGLRGAPVELVKAETVDIEVPATAEFIIEGVFIPESETTIGNHSNPVGYYDAIQVFPRFEVTAITHRKNPLWYATMEMIPPFDHNYQALIPVETEVLADLQGKAPEVHDVVVTPNMTYIVQLNVDGARKPHAEFGKFILHAVWGSAGRWGRCGQDRYRRRSGCRSIRYGLGRVGHCDTRAARDRHDHQRIRSGLRARSFGAEGSPRFPGCWFADRHRRDNESARAFRKLPGSQPADARGGRGGRGQTEGPSRLIMSR